MGWPGKPTGIHRTKTMKRLALVIVVLSSLAGCIVAPLPPPPGAGPGYRGHDRDRDGVPNRYDRRPNNPNRY
jgi:hypothetical protein